MLAPNQAASLALLVASAALFLASLASLIDTHRAAKRREQERLNRDNLKP